MVLLMSQVFEKQKHRGARQERCNCLDRNGVWGYLVPGANFLFLGGIFLFEFTLIYFFTGAF